MAKSVKNNQEISKSEETLITKSKNYNKMLKDLEYSWNFPEMSDDDLKKIAKDIVDNKIFTDRHCSSNDIMSIFMPMMFMGHISWPTEDTRENKLIKIFLKEKEKSYKKRYKIWLNNVGLVYEYLSKAGPMAVNGCPIFYSCRFLSKESTEKMFKYYDEYLKLKKEIDEKFKNI